jgi:hypothetical protein
MNYRVGLAIALVATTCACHDKVQDAGKDPPVEAAPKVAESAPTPPPRTGHARVVNLYVDAAGQHVKVDVWAGAAVAQGLEYGTASSWFSPPEDAPIVVVPAGAGPGAAPLGTLTTPALTQHETGTLTWMRQTATAAVGVFWDSGDPGAPAPPPPGKGVLVIRADALWEHERDLTPTNGSVAFFVGDGSGKCLHQRVEDEGFAAAAVGGPNPVIVDLPPGKHTITLHRWPGKPCTTRVALRFDVEITAGAGVLALVHSADSKRLSVLQLPLGL